MSAECGTKVYWQAAQRLGQIALLLVVPLAVGACKSSSHLASIEQLDQPPDIKLNYYTVSRNDTLYSIAWRYGMDYRELASINGIPAPYVIEVGQKINLKKGSSGRQVRSAVTAPSGVKVIAIAQDAHPVTEVGPVTEVSPANSIAVEPPSASVPVKQNAEHVVKQSPQPVAAENSRWIWPTNGRIVSQFSASDTLKKGIDLEGKLGDPVRAAGSGSVVYAGSGLAGYGELVIIKHDDQFLSAYGHNSKLLVREGDTVRVGQEIAQVGSSGTDSDKLHFEIRQAGKPVDPLIYLPKK